MKKLLNRKFIIWGLIILVLILLAITATITVFNVKKQNHIDDINTAIENVYSSFESAESRSEKYNILKEFISNTEKYSEYDENKENFNITLDDMKVTLIDCYEAELTKNPVVISDDITKEELNTFIVNLNDLKIEIEADEITSKESIISKIDEQIKIYTDKIAEIEAAEKAEEERLKKEAEEKAKKEAEEAAAKKAAEEVQKQTANNSSTGSGSNSSSGNNSSSSNASNNSSSNFNGMEKFKFEDETGVHYTYRDSKGNVYDENGNYLFNMNEWATNW